MMMAGLRSFVLAFILLVLPLCPSPDSFHTIHCAMGDSSPLLSDTVGVNITIDNSTYRYAGVDLETVLGETFSFVLDNDTVNHYLSSHTGLFFYRWTAQSTSDSTTLVVAGFNESVFIELVMNVDKEHQRVLDSRRFADQDTGLSLKDIMSRTLEEASVHSIQLLGMAQDIHSSLQIPKTGLPVLWTQNITGKTLPEMCFIPQIILFTNPYSHTNLTQLHWEVIVWMNTTQTARLEPDEKAVFDISATVIMVFSPSGVLLEISRGPHVPMSSNNYRGLDWEYWAPIVATSVLGVIVLMVLGRKLKARAQ
jgi:hypothetical protein